MTKAILLGGVLVIGMAAFGTAQTAPDVAITTQAMTQNAGTFHLTGGVDITIDGVHVTADEADLHRDKTIDLRGTVTMTPSSSGTMQRVTVRTR